MAINAQIPLGVQPFQAPDQMNMLAKALAIKGAQQESQARAMQMEETQRAQAENKLLNSAYAGAMGPDGSIDRNKLFNSLATQNLGSRIPALQKQFLDVDKGQGEIRAKAAESYKVFQSTLGSHFNNPNVTKQDVLGSVGALVQAGAFDANVAQRLVQSLPDDPTQLRMALRQIVTSQMTPEQQLTAFAPKPEKVDNGQQIGFRDTNPNSPTYGQATAGGVVQKVADPGAVLSAQTSEANNRRSVGAQYDLNKATREAAQTQANATRDAAKLRYDQDTEMKLADDYRTQSKPFKEVSDAYKTITTALDKATTSPAATLAGATKFMKLLDPGSVVRESELGMALAATGVFDRALNYHQTLLRGKVLTPQQAADFKNIAGQIYQAAQQQQQMIDKDYTGKAKTYGLRPGMVTQDLGQNGKPGGGSDILDQADAILRGGK